MPFQQNNQARFIFHSQAVAEGSFAVAKLTGDEALSRPYRFDLTLVSERADLDMDAIIAQPASLSLYRGTGEEATVYRGILAELEVLRQAGQATFYRAVLVPRFWRFGLYRLSEVYLGEKTIPETIESILQEGGLASGLDYEMKLNRPYRPRSYVCQYQETYFDFISRWLEKEGIYYWFEDGGDREKIIFTDNRFSRPDKATPLVFRPSGQLDVTLLEDTMHAFTCRQTPLPAKVVVQDYNYRKAGVEVKAEAQVSAQGFGQAMFYGENLRNADEAKAIAAIRAEELVCRGKLYHGETSAMGLRAGAAFGLTDHFRKDFNRNYLLTEIHHEGSQSGVLLAGLDGGTADEPMFYRCSFTGIPADIQFRPERHTPQPRFYGTMNATIDAEGTGKYAEVDEYGQYKVQLPFDLTEKNANKASAWLRMASPYAGEDHGMHLPLHKGTEVLLSFTDGDPDQPVIVGALANSINRNVVTNRNETQNLLHTAGGNTMSMEDREGGERILFKTPKANTWLRMGTPNDPPGTSRSRRPVFLSEEGGDGGGEGGGGEGGDGGEGGEGGESEETGFRLHTGEKYSAAIGSDYSVDISGNKFEFLLGSKEDITVGSSFEGLLGIESAAKLGSMLEAAYGVKTDVFKGLSMEWARGTVISNVDENELSGTEKVSISAAGESTAIKAVATAQIMAQVAATLIFMATSKGSSFPSKLLEGVIGGFGALLTTIPIACSIEAVAKKISYKSQIELDKNGIEMTAPKIELGIKRSPLSLLADPKLEMTSSEIEMSVGLIDGAEMAMKDDSIEWKVGETGKIEAKATEISMAVAPAGGKVEVAAAAATISTTDAAKIEVKATGITHTAPMFKVSADGAVNISATGEVKISGSGVASMSGSLIKIG